MKTLCQCCGQPSKLGWVAVCPDCFMVVDQSNLVFGDDAKRLVRRMKKSEDAWKKEQRRLHHEH